MAPSFSMSHSPRTSCGLDELTEWSGRICRIQNGARDPFWSRRFRQHSFLLRTANSGQYAWMAVPLLISRRRPLQAGARRRGNAKDGTIIYLLRWQIAHARCRVRKAAIASSSRHNSVRRCSNLFSYRKKTGCLYVLAGFRLELAAIAFSDANRILQSDKGERLQDIVPILCGVTP